MVGGGGWVAGWGRGEECVAGSGRGGEGNGDMWLGGGCVTGRGGEGGCVYLCVCAIFLPRNLSHFSSREGPERVAKFFHYIFLLKNNTFVI